MFFKTEWCVHMSSPFHTVESSQQGEGVSSTSIISLDLIPEYTLCFQHVLQLMVLSSSSGGKLKGMKKAYILWGSLWAHLVQHIIWRYSLSSMRTIIQSHFLSCVFKLNHMVVGFYTTLILVTPSNNNFPYILHKTESAEDCPC